VSELFPEQPRPRVRTEPTAGSVDDFGQIRRQYFRAREYCGFTLDELINSRAAQRYLREIWLLGCMVRKPRKAEVLPPGNPFREAAGPAGRSHSRHNARPTDGISNQGRSFPPARAYEELPDGGT